MKQILVVNFIVITMIVISCGNRSKNLSSNGTSDSLAVLENELTSGGNVAKTFALTKDGMGSLQLKHAFNDMSASDEGLYNKVEKETFYDESSGMTFQSYTLYLGDVEVATFMLEKESSPIEQITITSPNVYLKNGVKVGMPLREVLSKDGINAALVYDPEADSGILNIKCGKGLFVGLQYGNNGQNELSEKGKAKAVTLTTNGDLMKLSEVEEKEIPLSPEDFKPEAKVTCFCIDRRFEE